MQLKDLFVTRDVTALLEETHSKGEELKKSIGAFGLTALGVGAIIGTGIFVVIGKGAAVAGPALVTPSFWQR
jgi:basic amino acid/polyamine antiporter, APA family